MPAASRVCIIGAGLAGLACARRFSEAGLACTVLERSNGVGGRARTDRVEGFQLDRGFQVFLSGYPEAARSSITLYFDAPAAPHRGPWLMLNGEGHGLVRTVCVLSEAAPSYAPVGRVLISVTVAEPIQAGDNLPQAVQAFLQSWFGPSVNTWRHLRTDHISRALPPVEILPHSPHGTFPRAADGLYLCGDYRESGTLDGALLSGRKAADAVLMDCFHS
jgi:predicted NAD/FAD-dependent oxidoreductase